MILDRLASLMHRLTDQTVFAELLSPVERVLARVRSAHGLGRTLSMSDFIALGVLRHLQGMGTLREQVQTLLHLDPAPGARAPLARSTWSDALCSAARLGVPEDVQVETRSRHETAIVRDYDRSPQALTHERKTLFLVDRAFIDARFWDAKKATCAITIITRMKSNLRIDSTEDLGVAADPVNAGVQRDLCVRLSSSSEPWRLITYRTRRGHLVEFLTNDFDLQPGVVAFLYSRRWEEEISH